jgi:hypothetical protein
VAVNLIRKNNGVGITAFQDAVLFHLAKGENGVIPNVHEEFEASFDYTTKILTVASGMGIAYGRQFEVVPGEEIQFDFSALAGTRYIVIYLEIDLRDPTNETASLKATYSDSAYPEITEGDNLISSPNGLYRMLIFHVIKTSSTTTITPMFKVLLSDKIKSSIFSEEAEHADDASTVNGIEINALSGKLIAKMPGNTRAEYIERRILVFDGENSPYNYSGNGVWLGPTVSTETGQGVRSITLTEAIAEGDVLEFIVLASQNYYVARAVFKKSSYLVNPQLALCIVTNQTTGPYAVTYYMEFDVSGDGLTLTPNNDSIYLLNNPYANNSSGSPEKTTLHIWKVHKILGGIA